MSVQENFNCDEQQLFSPKDRWKNLSSSSLGKFRTEQLQESELRAKGTSLPSTMVQELDHYSETDNLPKAIQKYKKEVPHFLSTKRVTAETANPNFIDKLKEHKLDSLQHVNTNYKLTEATRVQAREATEIFSKLEFLNRRSLESRDETVIKNAVESIRELAINGFGAAKLQESEARETTLQVIKLPTTLKHIQPPQSSGDKIYAFGENFTSQSKNNRGGYTKRYDSHEYRGRGGYSNNNNRSRRFPGRGRGA